MKTTDLPVDFAVMLAERPAIAKIFDALPEGEQKAMMAEITQYHDPVKQREAAVKVVKKLERQLKKAPE